MKEQYEKAVQRYINAFCDKQNLEFGFWAAEEVGEVCFINDFSFDFSDIRRDIDNKVPIGKIIEWYDYSMINQPSMDYKIWLIKNN
jgi:hypothetical protein